MTKARSSARQALSAPGQDVQASLSPGARVGGAVRLPAGRAEGGDSPLGPLH